MDAFETIFPSQLFKKPLVGHPFQNIFRGSMGIQKRSHIGKVKIITKQNSPQGCSLSRGFKFQL